MPRKEKKDRRGKGEKTPKVKDLWVKLLAARKKQKEELLVKLDEDLEKQLSGADDESKQEEDEAKEEAKEGEPPADEAKEGESEVKPEGDSKEVTKESAKPGNAKPKDDATPAAAKEVPDDSLQPNSDKCNDSVLLFVGGKDSGKTTQIGLFLNPNGKDNKTKPTTALEYTYGRKAQGVLKDVANIWELGGGLRLRSMLPVVIKPENLEQLKVIITIDLAQAGDVVPLLTKWFGLVRDHVTKAMEAMEASRKDGAKLARRIEMKSQVQWVLNPDVQAKHPDVSISPVPILVLCTKQDEMAGLSAVKRKTILNAIRFLCLTNGASCVTTDYKTKSQIQAVRHLLNHYGFGAPLKASPHLDPAKSILVPPGEDTFAKIGAPSGADDVTYTKSTKDEKLRLWRQAVEQWFEATGADKETDVAQEDMESREPSVDAMVQQKQDQLVQYRKEVERKAKLAAAEAKKSRR